LKERKGRENLAPKETGKEESGGWSGLKMSVECQLVGKGNKSREECAFSAKGRPGEEKG